MPTPWFVQDGDVLGFYNVNNQSAITHLHDPGSKGADTLYNKFDTDTPPRVGQVYNFPNAFTTYRFSLAVTLDPGEHISHYKGDML